MLWERAPARDQDGIARRGALPQSYLPQYCGFR